MKKVSTQTKTIILPIISDWHIGSPTGLCQPNFKFDNGSTHAPNQVQKLLYSIIYHNLLHDTVYLQQKFAADVIPIFTGHIIDGRIVENQSSMIKQATGLIAPLADLSRSIMFLRGAINARADTIHDMLGLNIGNLYPNQMILRSNSPILSPDQFEEDINGVLINVMHKGTVGLRPWTKINPLLNLAQQVIIERTERCAPIPRLVIRAHAHEYADTYEHFRQIRVIQVPSLQISSPDGIRSYHDGEPTIPGYTILVMAADGTFTVHTRLFDPSTGKIIAL